MWSSGVEERGVARVPTARTASTAGQPEGTTTVTRGEVDESNDLSATAKPSDPRPMKRAQTEQKTHSRPLCAFGGFVAPLTGLLVVVWLTGCAAFPQFGDPPLVGPPAPNDRIRQPEFADSLRIPDPEDWTHVSEPRPAPSEDQTAEEPALAGPPHIGPPVSAEIEETKAAPITVSLPEGEMAARESRAREELAEAKRLIGGLESGSLQKSEKDKLRNVRGLVEQAERALDEDDIQAAEGLARKAKLLAVELSPN